MFADHKMLLEYKAVRMRHQLIFTLKVSLLRTFFRNELRIKDAFDLHLISTLAISGQRNLFTITILEN